jgi:hypothetical protein
VFGHLCIESCIESWKLKLTYHLYIWIYGDGGGDGGWQVYWFWFFWWLLSVGFVLVKDDKLGLSIYEVSRVVDISSFWRTKRSSRRLSNERVSTNPTHSLLVKCQCDGVIVVVVVVLWARRRSQVGYAHLLLLLLLRLCLAIELEHWVWGRRGPRCLEKSKRVPPSTWWVGFVSSFCLDSFDFSWKWCNNL